MNCSASRTAWRSFCTRHRSRPPAARGPAALAMARPATSSKASMSRLRKRFQPCTTAHFEIEEDAMAIVRWTDPFREFAQLQDQINRVLTDAYRGDEGFASGAWAPPVDIYQNGDHEVVLKAELP